jgi:homogentisate 1,2-dioxygenase
VDKLRFTRVEYLVVSGAIEKSIGAKSTEELAVMLDTFAPLYLTNDGLGIEDAEYYRSWLS